MTSATTTPGVGGGVAGAAFLQAIAASVSTAASAMAASRRIPGIDRFRIDLIRPTIMHAPPRARTGGGCLALFSSLVLVKRTRRVRDGTQAEKDRQGIVRRGRKRDPDRNPAGGRQAQERSRRGAGRPPRHP